MRLAGASLLVFGFVLCLNIDWAPMGFLAMGLGLICLLAADHWDGKIIREGDRRRHPRRPGVLPARPMALRSRPAAGPLQHHVAPQPSAAAQAMPAAQALAAAQAPPAAQALPAAYDAGKWRALVEADGEVARLVAAISPFGDKYVDQLAQAYLLFDERGYFPVLVYMVAERIRKDFGLVSRAAAPEPAAPDADEVEPAAAEPHRPPEDSSEAGGRDRQQPAQPGELIRLIEMINMAQDPGRP